MKTKVFLTMSVICIILFLPTLQSAQEGRGKGRIVGVVLDEEGKPIDGVDILLEAVNFNFKLTTKSNAKGEFGILGFGKGIFKFTFTKKGFLTGLKNISLSGAGKNENQKIVMKKAPTVPQGAIKVTEAFKADFKKANAFYKEKKFAEAVPLYKAILVKKPEAYQIRLNLANCLSEMKKYPEAVNEYEQYMADLKKETPDLKGNAKAAEALVSIGSIYMAQKDYDKAAENYLASMKLAPPTDAAVAYNVAEICFSAGKIDESIKYYKLAAKLRPKFAGYQKKLGYAYLNKGDMATAKIHFTKFLEMAPNDAEADSIKEIVKSI